MGRRDHRRPAGTTPGVALGRWREGAQRRRRHVPAGARRPRHRAACAVAVRRAGGGAGVMVAKLFGEEPGQQLRDDLRRFKQVMETGEVVLSDGSREGQAGAVEAAPGPAARSGGGIMKATCWMGKKHVEVRDVPDPQDPEPAGRDRQDHVHRDLRLRPPPLQRLHAVDAEGRHPRPRVHGRSGRGRTRRVESQGRRPRGRALHHRLRSLLALRGTTSGRCARTRTRTQP